MCPGCRDRPHTRALCCLLVLSVPLSPAGTACHCPRSPQVPIKAWLSTYTSEDTFEWFSTLPGGFLVSARLEQPRGHPGEVGGSPSATPQRWDSTQVPRLCTEGGDPSLCEELQRLSSGWTLPGFGPGGAQPPPSSPRFPDFSPAAGIRGGQPGAAPLPAPAQPPRHPEGLVLLQTGPGARPAPARQGNPLPGRLPGSQLRSQPAGLPGEPGPARALRLEKPPDLWRALWRGFEPPQLG